MQEFKQDFTVSFSFDGTKIIEFVSLGKLKRFMNRWSHSFRSSDGRIRFVLFGTIDADGDIRTSGPCTMKDGSSRLAQFGVEVYAQRVQNIGNGIHIGYIDDVDVIEVDSMKTTRDEIASVLNDMFLACADGVTEAQELTDAVLEDVLSEVMQTSGECPNMGDIRMSVVRVLKKKLQN